MGMGVKMCSCRSLSHALKPALSLNTLLLTVYLSRPLLCDTCIHVCTDIRMCVAGEGW